MSMTLYHNGYNPANSTEQYAVMLDMLERAEADNVLDIAFSEVTHAKKKGRSVRFSRWAIPATNTTPVAEGINNIARSLVPEDIFVTIDEYSETFAYSSQAADLDPLDYAKDVGEVGHDLVKLDRTAIRWATMIAGIQRIFNSSAHTTRNQVNGVITGGRLDQAITILRSAKAKTYSDLKLGSNRVGTTGLMPSFLAFGHEHLRPDFEKVPGWQPASQYPSDIRLNAYEAGSLASGRLRVILSPELEPIADAGATKGSANLRSTTGTSVDVYPIVIVGKYALKSLSLRGSGTRGSGNLDTYTINGPDRVDPANLTRYWSAHWYDANFIAHELWMIRVEVACTAAYQ
ncbi:MAG: N4-gp56 family major capsid protein [bacterium]|nr:N4-gp56 family major capsid protein [bacterium]